MTLITRRPRLADRTIRTEFDAEAWRYRFDERVGMLTADAGLSNVEACSIAGQEATHDWMRNNLPDAYSVSRCRHCKRMLDDTKIPIRCSTHAYVHRHCIVGWVSSRIEAAHEAMIAAGFPKQCLAQPPRPQPRIDELLGTAHLEAKQRTHRNRILMSFGDARELEKLMQGKLPREAA